MRYGATLDDWYNLVLLGYEKDLLPVVSNPNAPVSPKSSLKQLGKVPSRYNRGRQIVGIANWTQHKSTAKEIETWSKEDDFGICIQTREIRALDIDVSDPVLAKAIEDFLLCGKEQPVRRRANSAKLLVPFIMKGEFPKRVVKVEGGIIEFLANGQQFIAIGTHPSGARYEGLENVDSLPEITIDQFEALWKKLIERFAIEAPSSSTLRNAPDGDYAAPDEVSQYLADQGHVTGIGKEGQHFLKCPFAHEHTDPDAPDGTSTAYFPPSRGYEQGHWRCLHAHCHNRGDADFLDAIGYRIKDFDVIPPEPEAKATGRFQLINFRDFSNREPPGYIIDKILPKAELGIIYGASTAGKSFVALDMAFAIARGTAWNGFETKKGRVVYIAAEGAAAFAKRVKAYMVLNTIVEDLPFDIIADSPNFFLKDDAVAFAKAIGKADVIFDDTLAQTSVGANENSAEDVAKILSNFKGVHRATGAMMIPLHHLGKDESKGARGSTAIKAGADVEISVSRKGEDRLIKITKQKDGEDGAEFPFRLKTVQLDLDTTSCVVEYTNTPARKTHKVKPVRRGRNQIMILETFEKINHGGEVHPATLKEEVLKLLPPSRKSMQDKREQRITDSLDSLIEQGELSYADGMIRAPL